MPGNRIPPALIGTTAPVLADAYTHAQLNSLFLAAGFPGDAPDGNKLQKCQDWMRRANTECEDSLSLYGTLIAEFMEAEAGPGITPPWWANSAGTDIDRRHGVRTALAKVGLSYGSGGFILGASLTGPSRSLAERLEKEGLKAVETEYQRAYEQIETDPPAAVTAACAILETVCKTYLKNEGHDLPSKQVLSSLWTAASGHLGLSPKDIVGDDLKQILTGLSSIAVGVAALRTHKGSAHGHTDEAPELGKIYRLQPRHARLAVHAAHTMALFVLETWEARRTSAP